MKKNRKIWIAVLVPVVWIGLLYYGVLGNKIVAFAEPWLPDAFTSLAEKYPTYYYAGEEATPNEEQLREKDHGAPGTWFEETYAPTVSFTLKFYYFVPDEPKVQAKSVPSYVPTAKEIAEANAVATYGNVQKNFEKQLTALKALKAEASKKDASADTKNAAKEEAKKAIIIDLQDWHSIDSGFMKKISESDSDVIIECIYEGKNYRFVIPASGAKMIEGVDWYGPLCMQDLYGNSYVEE